MIRLCPRSCPGHCPTKLKEAKKQEKTKPQGPGLRQDKKTTTPHQSAQRRTRNEANLGETQRLGRSESGEARADQIAVNTWYPTRERTSRMLHSRKSLWVRVRREGDIASVYRRKGEGDFETRNTTSKTTKTAAGMRKRVLLFFMERVENLCPSTKPAYLFARRQMRRGSSVFSTDGRRCIPLIVIRATSTK